MKKLNKNAKLYDLASKYPEIVSLMDQLGFHEITLPGMLASAGRMVTIPVGARMKHIDWEEIERVFAAAGFEFVDADEDEESSQD